MAKVRQSGGVPPGSVVMMVPGQVMMGGPAAYPPQMMHVPGGQYQAQGYPHQGYPAQQPPQQGYPAQQQQMY